MADITKNKRIFPIKVEPACLLKWSWSTIFFNSGTSASCHRTQKYAIDPKNFDNFHNLPEKISARELMLQGQWPQAGCQYCQRVELAGGVSDRQYQLESQGDACQHPPELDVDPTATEVTPTILEVYFKNTCNMACVYCGPHFSSRWEDENRRFDSNFGGDDRFDVRHSQDNPYYDQMVSNLWNYLETNDRYKVLRRYHILGGEPFLLKELDDSINFWDQHPNLNLVFSIITNLNIPTERFAKYVNKFEQMVADGKIWKFQITASLDGIGNEQEYARYGINLDLWQRNFEMLLGKPWVTLSINTVISALTIKQTYKLIEKINYWNSLLSADQEPIQHTFLTSDHCDTAYIFGSGVFDSDFARILELMPEVTESQKSVKTQMQSIANAVSQGQRNVTKIKKLKDYLSTLDHRRNTNWKEVYPWLDQQFD